MKLIIKKDLIRGIIISKEKEEKSKRIFIKPPSSLPNSMKIENTKSLEIISKNEIQKEKTSKRLFIKPPSFNSMKIESAKSLEIISKNEIQKEKIKISGIQKEETSKRMFIKPPSFNSKKIESIKSLEIISKNETQKVETSKRIFINPPSPYSMKIQSTKSLEIIPKNETQKEITKNNGIKIQKMILEEESRRLFLNLPFSMKIENTKKLEIIKKNEFQKEIKKNKIIQIEQKKTLENILYNESRLKNKELDLSKKLELYFIKDINAFEKNKFEYRLFKNIQKLIKKKSTEQKLKYIFLKIYQNLENNLLSKIHYLKNKNKLIELKRNSSEFQKFFNWFYFDIKKLKRIKCRIYNPKNKNLSFNFKFIHMIFQNKFFFDCSMKFLNSEKFKEEILKDIFFKIDMICNLIKIIRFKSEESFFECFKRKSVNKIPWKICQVYDAKKFFLEKL